MHFTQSRGMSCRSTGAEDGGEGGEGAAGEGGGQICASFASHMASMISCIHWRDEPRRTFWAESTDLADVVCFQVYVCPTLGDPCLL